MRSLHKSWKNSHGPKGKWQPFTRRVQWYQQTEPLSIRLKFEDTDGIGNEYYTDKDAAQKDYEAFIKGNLTVSDVWKRK